jgi:hypothetical protein
MSYRKTIDNFNPSVEKLNKSNILLSPKFNAGDKCYQFNSFLSGEALSWLENGNGVTYLVFDNIDKHKKLIAYYTLAVTSIPFIDRIKDGESDYDEQLWGIPSVEIKMFAVSKEYQDLFFEDKPIAAWILQSIISDIDNISSNIVGIKAIFLHSTEDGESFYEMNEFHDLEINMSPLHSADDGLREMYLAIRPFHMNYEV